MEITIEDIINEKQYCCDVVKKAIEKHCNASITEFKIRQLLQLVLKDELHPLNEIKFYIEFAKQYVLCETIKDIKKALIKNLK